MAHRILVTLLLALWIFSGSSTVLAQENTESPLLQSLDRSFRQLFERSKKSVTCVLVETPSLFGRKQMSSGSGIVVDKKLVLTSSNLIPNQVGSVAIQLWDHRRIQAKVLVVDRTRNLSLLQVQGKTELVPIPLGDSDLVQVGDTVLSIGNPFGSYQRVNQPALSLGSISGIYTINQGEKLYKGKVFETDSAVNPGSFGGPLLNSRGEVIGIVNQSHSYSRWLGVAVPANIAKTFLNEFRTGALKQFVARTPQVRIYKPKPAGGGYLGVRVRPNSLGMEVLEVMIGSAAADAGIQVGDIITALGDEFIRDLPTFANTIRPRKPGDNITVYVIRDQKRLQFRVILGSDFM